MSNNAKLKSLPKNNNQDPERAVHDWLLVCVAKKYWKAQSLIYFWFYFNIFHNSLEYSIFFSYLLIYLFIYLFSGVKKLLSYWYKTHLLASYWVYFAIAIGRLIISYALLTRVRSLLFISVQNLNHSLWHHRLRCHSGISFVHSNSPQTNWYWRCLNWPFGHGLFIGYLFKMDCGQRAGFFLPLKWSFVRRLLGTRCTHACQSGCGTHVLQISRLISIRKFGQLRPSVASRPKEGGHGHCGWARGCPRNSKQLT